ncbi:hypothetical protein TNCV_4330241 [Trichonephila clavipes]|nr:hypothetical protein TNCV_4330241 [Trichonephila clavipes]
MQISPSRVELAARGTERYEGVRWKEALFPSHTDWLHDGRVHERRESRYDSGVQGHRLQWSSRSEVFRRRNPVRRTPAHTMFARLHQQLCETGSFQKAARNRGRLVSN